MSAPEDDEPKTLFIPAGKTGAPRPTPALNGETAEDAWFAGGADAPAYSEEQPTAPLPGEPSTWADLGDPNEARAAPLPQADPRTVFRPSSVQRSGRIEIGSVLNGIYEVREFIARGGMGEVYKGANVHSDEPVAIKIILAHLADDPNVLAMFRKEARTLTRLNHPALVRYRVLAEEPTLGVFYIVTEFIDGPSLRDYAKDLKPTPDDLVGFIRRLAQGLETAHDLGAVHRDIAPDNILLPGRELKRAVIIDFGITKDLDPATGTIIGDGFAGKLDFVAPEQLGAFGREVGPWTDIYSLGLVVLAAANGRPIDMGATLFDALQRRQATPDTSSAPPGLRAVIDRMTAPDPKQRFRSMGEVIAALDALDAGGGAAVTRSTRPGGRDRPHRSGFKWPVSPVLMIAAGSGLAAVLLLSMALPWPRSRPRPPSPPAVITEPSTTPAPTAVLLASKAAMAIDCAWIEVSSSADGLILGGAAGAPAAVPDQIAGKLNQAGLKAANESNVHTLAPQACSIINTLGAYRQPSGETPLIRAENRHYHVLTAQPADCETDDRAEAIGYLKPRDGEDFTIVALDPDGRMQQIEKSKADFLGAVKADAKFAALQPDGSYQLHLCMTAKTASSTLNGLHGYLVISGMGPFDLPSLSSNAADPVTLPPDWPNRFRAMAGARGWVTQIAWLRIEP